MGEVVASAEQTTASSEEISGTITDTATAVEEVAKVAQNQAQFFNEIHDTKGSVQRFLSYFKDKVRVVTDVENIYQNIEKFNPIKPINPTALSDLLRNRQVFCSYGFGAGGPLSPAEFVRVTVTGYIF